jgi:hypothetical protein
MNEGNLTLISLVGAQAAPNILPLSHFNPDRLILITTNTTKDVAKRTADVIKNDYDIFIVEPFCFLPPYRLADIMSGLNYYIKENVSSSDQLLFNITSATKPLAIAAYEMAKSLSAGAFYYESQDNHDLIHPFYFKDNKLILKDPEICQATMTLDRFLRLYVEGYVEDEFHDDFEKKVFNALTNLGKDYEVFHNVELQSVSGDLEIDWILRYRNSIAVGEVKAQAGKSSIDQLNSACHPQKLGTYTKKFLISGKPSKGFQSFHPNHVNLMKAYNIHGMILESYDREDLSPDDKNTLMETIVSIMEKGRH